MKSPKLKRKILDKLFPETSYEEQKKRADEIDELIFERKKDEFLSNVELKIKISKFLKRLGETKTYIEPKSVHLRQIAFYMFRFGIQRGDVFGIDIEKAIFNLIKQLSELDYGSLYILSYSFRGMIYKFNKWSKNENTDILKLIENFDELDYGSPEIIDHVARIKDPTALIDKLTGKFKKFIDPYLSALPKVKEKPQLYTKLLIPIYPYIMESLKLKNDRELIHHLQKITHKKYSTIEKALNRYRVENER